MANPFFVQPAQYGPALQQAAGAVDKFGQEQQVKERQEAARSRLKEAVQSGDPLKMRNAVAEFPEIGETMEQVYNFTNDQTRQIAIKGYTQALSEQDPERAARIIEATAETISQFGGTPTITARDAAMIRRDQKSGMRNIKMGLAAVAPDVYDRTFGGAGSQVPAQTQAFNALVEASKSEDPTVKQAARIELGLEPRAGTLSADQRTALDEYLKGKVVDLERETTAAKEEGRLETQREMMPQIRQSIKEAEQQAESRGEALSEYGRAKAAQPGLREVVDKLKTLSDVATYTMGGRAFDTVVKELGFGATEGATARAKMESLVNNQILPLLRDTFGAQFTEREGEQLRKTMMDIDAAPEQKKEILDSFIGQKMRDLEMKRKKVEESGGMQDTGGMSDDDADALIDSILGQ